MRARDRRWRWLDIRALSQRLVSRASRWQGAVISRVVYCTAVIDAATNPSGYNDQDIYLRALTTANSVDHVAYGSYVARVKYAPLAVKAASRSGRPQLVHPQWPVMVQDANGNPVPDATFVVSYAHREEKGSDVNVAAHLLVDVLTGVVDAAVVVSNDSDLEFPVSYARTRVPVGLVNPSGNYFAGALRGQPSDGVGSHWWRQRARCPTLWVASRGRRAGEPSRRCVTLRLYCVHTPPGFPRGAGFFFCASSQGYLGIGTAGRLSHIACSVSCPGRLPDRILRGVAQYSARMRGGG